MKVLVITNMYPTADRPHFGIFVEQQVAGLRAAGLNMVVEQVAGVRGRADYLLGRRRVRRRVQRERPDVVHVHFGYTGLAAMGHGPPVVLTLHGTDVHGAGHSSVRRRIGSAITRRMAARADRVIVQSEAMKLQLPAAIANRVDVIPNGIDEELFRPIPIEEARVRLGLPMAELVLLFVDASRSANKRLDLAEATVAELRRQGRSARLLVAQQVRPEEMPWYYAAANALLLTSDHEGSPMCVKEALACGRPVVSVSVGDVAKVLDTPSRGVIAARDPVALARAAAGLADMGPGAGSLLPAWLRSAEICARVAAVYDSASSAGRVQ